MNQSSCAHFLRRPIVAGIVSLTVLIPTSTTVLAGEDATLATGPDVVVFDLYDTYRWGSSGDTTAYSVGTESCNRGTEPVSWISTTNQHPVIGQNLYRLADGRLEQLGMSWLKHGFLSVNGDACDTCQHPPNGGAQLGVGCSDPYSAGLNGSQSRLGPRSEVDAFTGVYTYPHGTPSGTSTLAGRLLVKTGDVEPIFNPGALYFVEGQYVTADDAQSGNANNNASHREVTIGTGNVLVLADTTHEAVPAIYAWQEIDPTVTTLAVDVPSEGRFHVAYRTSDNGDGTWHYEYAIYNLNSHLSAGSFTVPTAAGAVITNIGFHDVDYHSGEPYDGTDWAATVAAASVTWATTPYSTDPDANALRWGTMYNFWFDADQPPEAGMTRLGMFRPNGVATTSFTTAVPGHTAGIFSDGFESGDVDHWSQVMP